MIGSYRCAKEKVWRVCTMTISPDRENCCARPAIDQAEQQVIHLSPEAAARFAAALEEDADPSHALTELMERHAAIRFVSPDRSE